MVVTLSGRSRRRPWPVRPAARESPNALTITRCAQPVGITGPRPGSRGGRGREICVFAMILGLSLIHISEPTRPERISYAVF